MIKMLIRFLISILIVSLGTSSPSFAKDSEKALFKKARRLIDEKKNVDAQAVYQKIIQNNPRSAEAHAGLGWTYYTQGQGDLAEVEAQKALQINNKIPMAHSVMGAIYFSKGKVEEAKNEFRTVLKLNPNQRCGGCSDLRGLLGPEIGLPPKKKK